MSAPHFGGWARGPFSRRRPEPAIANERAAIIVTGEPVEILATLGDLVFAGRPHRGSQFWRRLETAAALQALVCRASPSRDRRELAARFDQVARHSADRRFLRERLEASR